MAMQIVLGVKEVYYEIVQVENRGFVLRVYIFAHLHTALRTEENMLSIWNKFDSRLKQCEKPVSFKRALKKQLLSEFLF